MFFSISTVTLNLLQARTPARPSLPPQGRKIWIAISKRTTSPSPLSYSAIAPQRQGVVSLPRLPSACCRLVESVPFAQATRFFASRGKAATFAVLGREVSARQICHKELHLSRTL